MSPLRHVRAYLTTAVDDLLAAIDPDEPLMCGCWAGQVCEACSAAGSAASWETGGTAA